jgi:hypothetical protein
MESDTFRHYKKRERRRAPACENRGGPEFSVFHAAQLPAEVRQIGCLDAAKRPYGGHLRRIIPPVGTLENVGVDALNVERRGERGAILRP